MTPLDNPRKGSSCVVRLVLYSVNSFLIIVLALVITNPHVKTKLIVLRPLIYLDQPPPIRVAVKENQRSEKHRFGLDVRVGGTKP